MSERKAMKPIIFNAEMVQAILDERKRMTRRPIKRQPSAKTEYIYFDGSLDAPFEPHRRIWAGNGDVQRDWYEPRLRAGIPESMLDESKPDAIETWRDFADYAVGDILYVLETWAIHKPGSIRPETLPTFEYVKLNSDLEEYLDPQYELVHRAGKNIDTSFPIRWRPSIHMKRWMARIFLEVTAVRAERVQEITTFQAEDEGISPMTAIELRAGETSCIAAFRQVWDSICAKRGLGWDANPWVWVYEFKRVEECAA